MKKVILIHGYTSSPKKKKYQIISKELNHLGAEYSIPVMPGGERPRSEEWLKIIDEEVKNSAGPVILVGHSLGTRAVLLYLDKFNEKVDAVILIAAFNNDFENNGKINNGIFADFFESAIDIEKVRKLSDKFIVAHSKDDEVIDYKQGVEMADNLKAELITYENAGHFTGEERAEENAGYFLKVIKSVL